jgi:hypothetical protein
MSSGQRAAAPYEQSTGHSSAIRVIKKIRAQRFVLTLVQIRVSLGIRGQRAAEQEDSWSKSSRARRFVVKDSRNPYEQWSDASIPIPS